MVDDSGRWHVWTRRVGALDLPTARTAAGECSTVQRKSLARVVSSVPGNADATSVHFERYGCLSSFATQSSGEGRQKEIQSRKYGVKAKSGSYSQSSNAPPTMGLQTPYPEWKPAYTTGAIEVVVVFGSGASRLRGGCRSGLAGVGEEPRSKEFGTAVEIESTPVSTAISCKSIIAEGVKKPNGLAIQQQSCGGKRRASCVEM